MPPGPRPSGNDKLPVTKLAFSVPETCHFPGVGRHVGCHGTTTTTTMTDCPAQIQLCVLIESARVSLNLPGGATLSHRSCSAALIPARIRLIEFGGA